MDEAVEDIVEMMTGGRNANGAKRDLPHKGLWAGK